MKLNLAIFKNRQFSLFWLAGWLSSIGDAIFLVAITWLLAERTGSPLVVGSYLFVIGLMKVIFALVGGIIVDRFDIKRLLISADIIRAVAMFVLVAWLLAGTPPIWFFYLLGFIFGTMESITIPGGAFVATNVVTKEHYTQAMSVFLVTENVSAIVGPLFGAGLLALGSAQIAVGINGISFAISAILLSLLVVEMPPRKKAMSLKEISRDLREGFAFFFSNQVIYLMSLNAFFANAALGLAVLATPFLVLNRDLGVESFGIIKSGIGAGGVIGGVILSLFVIAKPKPFMALITTFGQGVLFIIIALTGKFWLIVIAFAFIGLFEAVVNVIAPSINHTIIPRHLFGRVISVMIVFMEGSQPLFQATGGYLMESVNVETIFLIGGAMDIVIAVLIFLIPAIRNYE